MEIVLGCQAFLLGDIPEVPFFEHYAGTWCPTKELGDNAVITADFTRPDVRHYLVGNTEGRSAVGSETEADSRQDLEEIPGRSRSKNRFPLEEEMSVQVQILSEEEASVQAGQSTNVVTIPMMKSLQEHLPFCKRGESFWLQYSLVRDGASLDMLLSNVKMSEYTLLAIETTEGEVFGCFTAEPWKISNDYFGSGQSFLWRLDQRRGINANTSRRQKNRSSNHSTSSTKSRSSTSRKQREQLQVFKFAFLNHNIQLCRPDRLVVGGGNGPKDGFQQQWGFGLWLEHDLLSGSSSPCSTFQSPSLSALHSDGSLFEIRNLEVWALTPCLSLVEAESSSRKRSLLSGALLPRALSFGRRGRQGAKR